MEFASFFFFAFFSLSLSLSLFLSLSLSPSLSLSLSLSLRLSVCQPEVDSRVNGVSSPTVPDRGPLTENSGETPSSERLAYSDTNTRPWCTVLGQLRYAASGGCGSLNMAHNTEEISHCFSANGDLLLSVVPYQSVSVFSRTQPVCVFVSVCLFVQMSCWTPTTAALTWQM